MDAGTQPEAVVAGSLPADAPAGGELPEGDDSPLLLGAASKKQASREARLKIGIYSYRLVIAYDGTNYCGWQLQAGEVPTIQRTMEHVLTTITRKGTNRHDRETLCVSAAGRTDSGVHADGQVVQFFVNTLLDQSKLAYKLNRMLPPDIRVLHAAQTAPDFDVTCTAVGKIYRYSVDTGPAHSPLRYRFATHVAKPLDIDAMRAGAALLTGTHDFTQFSNDNKERLKRNPVKTIRRYDVLETPGGLLLEVEGDGFLYKQVRHMTGALLAVGAGTVPLQDLTRKLEVGNSLPPGATGAWRGYQVAPAKGLTLHTVHYPPGIEDSSTLLYPDVPHDEYGRPLGWLPKLAPSD